MLAEHTVCTAVTFGSIYYICICMSNKIWNHSCKRIRHRKLFKLYDLQNRNRLPKTNISNINWTQYRQRRRLVSPAVTWNQDQALTILCLFEAFSVNLHYINRMEQGRKRWIADEAALSVYVYMWYVEIDAYWKSSCAKTKSNQSFLFLYVTQPIKNGDIPRWQQKLTVFIYIVCYNA